MKNKKIFWLVFFVFILFSINSKVNALSHINKIEINYETEEVRVSPAYTYNEVRGQLTNNWTLPDETSYSKGNDNIYMYYCPTDERCIESVTGGYNEKIKPDRYTYVLFEIYANPYSEEPVNEGYDFDENDLENIEIWINGVEREDAFATNYSSSWRSVDVYVPVEVDSSPLVKSIEITSPTDYVEKGTSLTYLVNVDYYGDGYDQIVWSISGNTSPDTAISQSGVLTVAHDENAEYIMVKAASIYDEDMYDEKTAFILDEQLRIDSVRITTETRDIVKGGSEYFYVSVSGTAPHDVIWSISGNNSVNTSVSNDGLLTIDSAETATKIILTATSSYDDTKSNSAVINILDKKYINKIEIFYDKKETKVTTLSTYNEARNKFQSYWYLKSDANYGKGNDNVWMYYCPTNERCTGTMTVGYTEQIKGDRYTYVMFEIYAKPTGLNVDNPLYDFDEENLENIEIWVNGVKRTDAFVSGYDDSWRAVDVFIPVPVTNIKKTQVLYFDYDYKNVTYGASTFINYIHHTEGNGIITYKSLNKEVAEVNSTTGEVTIKGIGSTTIVATASETETYQEKVISYPLTVERKWIYPNVNIGSQTYTGSAIIPEVTVSYSGNNLIKGTDYSLEYQDNVEAGNAKVILRCLESSGYTFETQEVYFNISKRELTDENVVVPEKVAYYGDRVVDVNFKVIYNGKTLKHNVDYTYSLSNEGGEVGENVRLTVYGMGNFEGTVIKDILISPKEEVLILVKPQIKIKKGNNNSLVISWNSQNANEKYYIYRSRNKRIWIKIGETTGDSYTSGGLTYGRKYYYRVYAKNELHKTGYSNIVSLKVTPNRVENLKAMGVWTGTVRFSWDKVGVTGYQIQRSTNNKRWTTIATIKKNGTTVYTNSKLKANTTYYYRVRAYKQVRRSRVYGSWSAVLKVRTAPSVPKLTISLKDYNLFGINVGSVKGATRYYIYKSESINGTYEHIGTMTSGGTYLDGNVSLNKTYYYKVKACNSENRCSSYTSAVSRRAVPITPSIALKSTVTKKVRITLGKLNSVDGYEVYRATSKNGKYTLIKTLTDDDNLTFDNGTSKGKTYYYKVRSFMYLNGNKIYSSYSGIKSIRSK